MAAGRLGWVARSRSPAAAATTSRRLAAPARASSRRASGRPRPVARQNRFQAPQLASGARQRMPPRPAKGDDGRCTPERKARIDGDTTAREVLHEGSSDASCRHRCRSACVRRCRGPARRTGGGEPGAAVDVHVAVERLRGPELAAADVGAQWPHAAPRCPAAASWMNLAPPMTARHQRRWACVGGGHLLGLLLPAAAINMPQ